MLIVRVWKESIHDVTSFGQALRSDGCQKAAEVERTFSDLGIPLELITGVAHLISLDRIRGQDGEHAGDAGLGTHERSTQDESSTGIVFLHAIPVSLPLWSLLSSEDALGADMEATCSTPTAERRKAADEAGPLRAIGAEDSVDSNSYGVDNHVKLRSRSRLRFSPHDAARPAGHGDASRTALQRLQVVARAHTRCQYTAILYFVHKRDAFSFVSKYSGLDLPEGGTLKAFLVSEASILPLRRKTIAANGDQIEACPRRRRRRSLSEGATLAAVSVLQTGTEESKTNAPEGGGGGERQSCSPPRERMCSPSDCGPVYKGVDRPLKGRVNFSRDTVSPPPSLRTALLAMPRQRQSGASERKCNEGPPESLSPPWRAAPLSESSTKRALPRQPLKPMARAEGPAAGKGESGDKGGSDTGTVLPPCPVCLDRLDPTAFSLPSTTPDAVRRKAPASGQCHHKGCARYPEDDRFVPTDIPKRRQSSGTLIKGDISIGKGPPLEGNENDPGEPNARAVAREDVSQAAPARDTNMWSGSDCRVCRSLNNTLVGAPDTLSCETCFIAHNLWICMICGHIGCGRYTGEHANQHYRVSGHTFSLELSTGRVWDYLGDCYAHRALRGHFAPTNDGPRLERRHGPRDRRKSGRGAGADVGGGAAGARDEADRSPRLYPEGAYDTQPQPEVSKVAVVSREYEALVSGQMQEQQRYFEGLIAAAIAAEAEAHAPADEGLGDDERLEIASLRQGVQDLSSKYDGLVERLRAEEEEARRVRAENRTLVSEQRHQKQLVERLKEETRDTKHLCEKQMADLEGQMQDLQFFMRAQQEVKSSPQHEELVGGSVVMGGGGVGSDAAGVASDKDTERARLSRRLRELSNARRPSNTHR